MLKYLMVGHDVTSGKKQRKHCVCVYEWKHKPVTLKRFYKCLLRLYTVISFRDYTSAELLEHLQHAIEVVHFGMFRDVRLLSTTH